MANFEMLKKVGDVIALEPGCVAAALAFTDGSILFHTDAHLAETVAKDVVKKPVGNFYISHDSGLVRRFYDQYGIRFNRNPTAELEVPFAIPHQHVVADFASYALQLVITNTMVDWAPMGGKRTISVSSEYDIFWARQANAIPRTRDIRVNELVAGGRRFYKFKRENLGLFVLIRIDGPNCTLHKMVSEAAVDRAAMEGSKEKLMAHPNEVLMDRAIAYFSSPNSSFKKFQDLLKHERKETKRRSEIKD